METKTYTANDLYDMFANQTSAMDHVEGGIDALHESIAALRQSPDDIDMTNWEVAEAIMSVAVKSAYRDWKAAIERMAKGKPHDESWHAALYCIEEQVSDESEYGDPDSSLQDWLSAGNWDGSETVESVAADWDSNR